MGSLPIPVCLVPFVLALCLASPAPQDDDCYSTNSAPFREFTTHTDYNDVRGHGTDFTMPGCTPKKFYMLSRHGIRYPTSSSYSSEKHRLPRLHTLAVNGMHKGTMCKADQDALKHWEFRFPSHLIGMLSDTGKKEAIELGRRYEKRFPNLLGHAYSKERYDFQHTYITRTADTAKGIAEGFFNTSNFHMTTGSSHCDPLLLYYSCCQKFLQSKHEHTLDEHEAFRDSHEMNSVMSGVASRLGVSHGSFSFHDMEAMYDVCSFEHSIFRTSPWCAVFSNNDLRIMEYYKDLRYYYEYSYGHSIAYEQTCDLFKEMIGYLRGSSSMTGMIRVAHDLTLMPMYARLGVFRETVAPTARNYAQQTNRKWRSSQIASFLSNVAFVEYQCGADSKIRVFQNEKPLALSMCPASGCPLSDIVNSYLGKFASVCDFQKTCEYSSHHSCDGHVTHSGTCIPTIIG